MNAASGLPSGPSAQLLDAARRSFTAGLNAAADVGAVLFLALAVLAAILLGHVRPSGEEQPNTEPAGAVAGNVGVDEVSTAAPRSYVGS